MRDDSLDKSLSRLRQEMPDLRDQYGVTGLWIFGSRAIYEERNNSDLDLLVEFDGRPMCLFKFLELELLLSDRVGVQVDLVQRSALRIELQDSVFSSAVPI